MQVKVSSATPRPFTTCSLAAGCCYGHEHSSMKRLQTCMSNGHLSVFEHVSATWEIRGISRACSHQLVRHRVASYSQQSQRYCKIDVSLSEWYVTPPSIDEDHMEIYRNQMASAAQTYLDLLAAGFKPEDARYVLPNSTKTNIWVSMNFREFMHFLDLRDDKAAQWEIRELASRMRRALTQYDLSPIREEPPLDSWTTLLDMYDKIRIER